MIMEWKQLENGEWEAKGKNGKFYLYKSGRQWTGNYSGANGKFFRLPFGSLKLIKKKCEDNYYWEAKKD
jgi:hypothetical protein